MKIRIISLLSTVFCLLSVSSSNAYMAVNWLDSPYILSTTGFTGEYHPFDLNGDGIVNLTFFSSTSSIQVRNENSSQYLARISTMPDPLAPDAIIGEQSGSESMRWISDAVYAPLILGVNNFGETQWLGAFMGHRGYMGISFDIAGETHYGWMDIMVDFANPYAEIYGWGYETEAGVSVYAGAIPEPSTMHLLTIGALSFLVPSMRKRMPTRRSTTTRHKWREGER